MPDIGGKPGRVYLVGAGPGDPKLISVRGVELLRRADVVMIDRLANPKLLKHAREDARIINAGKASHEHCLEQDEIVKVMIGCAIEGKMVVRLKGGDPFVFGRGGEEAEALAAAGIEFEVVPGITSAVAAPAYAGIPVTSRTCASSFGVVTGHEAPGKTELDIKWDKISTGLDTIVLLMGVENLEHIVSELVANGRDAGTPVGVVRWGTYPSQRTVTGTLADIAEKCRAGGLGPPAVMVVGEVVRLREAIRWFERRPLFGKRVIVTRARAQAQVFTDRLEELGADVDEFPVIKFVAPADYGPLDAAIAELGGFDWIVFTSANGVEWFVRRLMESGLDIRALAGAKLGAIGPMTASALEAFKLKVDYVPGEYVAEAVVRDFPEDPAGKRILIPRASQAREELPEGLAARGAEVSAAAAYQTVTDDSAAVALRERLKSGGVDLITFTSPSTVRGFLALAGDVALAPEAVIACIGPITAGAARSRGLQPTVVAERYTIEGLVEAIVAWKGQSLRHPFGRICNPARKEQSGHLRCPKRRCNPNVSAQPVCPAHGCHSEQVTATLSPLHWKETHPRCFGNLVPETGEFLRSECRCIGNLVPDTHLRARKLLNAQGTSTTITSS